MQRVWLGSWLLLVGGIATADEPSARACSSIGDPAARLACYDAAFGVKTPPGAPPSGSAGVAASPVVSPAPAAGMANPPAPPAGSSAPAARPPAAVPPAAASPADAFGDTGHLKGREKPVPPKRETATVVSAVPLGQGLYRLTLDNGQIWHTIQADWALDFQTGNRVTISRMLAGNYLISHTGEGRTVSIKRIQ